MSKNKFTPGPWAAVFEPEWNQWSIRSANPADLAEAPVYYELASSIGGHVRGENFDDYSEVEANARLVAAAPDLLEALEMLLEETDPMKLNAGEPWCRVRTVIAKARGE